MRTVVFTLATPLGGFLQAATQPIAPAHVLAGIPVDELVDDPSGREPIGSGPFAVTALDDDTAELVPAVMAHPTASPTVGASPAATDSLATPARPDRPTRPLPYLAGIEFHFFDDQKSLADAYRAGEVDGASGLSPEETRDLAEMDGSHALDYPGSTLTAVLLNLRPGHPEFADPAVRTALLEAIDRSAIISKDYAAAATSASGPIPPSSSLFDPLADLPVAYDPAAATAALTKAGWTKAADGWHLPKAKAPLHDRAGQPRQGRPTRPPSRPPAMVAHDWTALGIGVDPRAARPGRPRHRPAGQGQVPGRRRGRHDRTGPRSLPAAGVEPDGDRWLERHRAAGSRPSTSCWWPPAGRAR